MNKAIWTTLIILSLSTPAWSQDYAQSDDTQPPDPSLYQSTVGLNRPAQDSQSTGAYLGPGSFGSMSAASSTNASPMKGQVAVVNTQQQFQQPQQQFQQQLNTAQSSFQNSSQISQGIGAFPRNQGTQMGQSAWVQPNANANLQSATQFSNQFQGNVVKNQGQPSKAGQTLGAIGTGILRGAQIVAPAAAMMGGAMLMSRAFNSGYGYGRGYGGYGMNPMMMANPMMMMMGGGYPRYYGF